MKKDCVFDEWYEQYVDELYAYGMSLGMGKEYVLDAIHDIFLHLYESAGKIEMPDNPKSYLLRSLKNRMISSLRKKSPALSLDDEDTPEFLIEVDACDAMEDEQERKAYEEQVKTLLDRLTNKQREVVYLHFMQGFNFEEISQILHITPKSVQKMTSRAFERMREAGECSLGMLIYLLTVFNE